jgi:CHAT domain-containing protein
LHVAGCRDVVASLWKVDDDATAALMALFYDKLLGEKKAPLTALREAQLTLYRNPHLVAPLARESALAGRLRGSPFNKTVTLPGSPEPAGPKDRSPVRCWAGFALGGLGR